MKGKPKLSVWKKAPAEPEPSYGTDDAIAFVTTLIVSEANLSIGRGVLIITQVPKDFPKVMGFAFVIAFYLKTTMATSWARMRIRTTITSGSTRPLDPWRGASVPRLFYV